MADIVKKQILAKLIQLADQVIKAADEASSFKSDCSKLKSKAKKLVTLLHQAAHAGNDLYEHPTLCIIDDTEQVLEKALALIHKCLADGLVKRVFTLILAADNVHIHKCARFKTPCHWFSSDSRNDSTPENKRNRVNYSEPNNRILQLKP
ncbi:hypothetical protein LOK49_LG04G01244 [Camellia lanceoleosa]|uniref:Uncharacterized protein n=1 Tax=Camellia lanceoleosa TaxID=1840588 RepID=A0ACC0I4R2_9ERIC|nr:hypothetical protein LOK49_LG04G01244 [Camellia lanceoleosa]